MPWWFGRRGTSAGEACCGFCGELGSRIGGLARGPGVAICGRCLPVAARAAAERTDAGDGRVEVRFLSGSGERCGFCSAPERRRASFVGSGSARICGDCLTIARDLIGERR